MSVKVPAVKRGRPVMAGVARPECPKGHEGLVQLNGRRLNKTGRFEKTRYRCLPSDRAEKSHDFLAPLAARRPAHDHGVECDSCERPFDRAEGLTSGWRYAFCVRDVAEAMVRAGRGDTYREISGDLRAAIGRRRARGRYPSKWASRGAQLVVDYLDAFGPLVAAELAPAQWPPIIAIDAKPLFAADHSACCGPLRAAGATGHLHPDRWGPPPAGRPKVAHAAPSREIGRILVAVGYKHPGDASPKPVLIRFAGGGDEVSWSEFLSALPGTPDWVVSDRDRGIINAVAAVFPAPATTHYFCEQHLADNAATAAMADGVTSPSDPLWPVLEAAQYGPNEWLALLTAAVGRPSLTRWAIDNSALIQAQWAKRKPFHPRSAGACEAVIRQVVAGLGERVPHFRNADRLNVLLALMCAQLNRSASLSAYSRILRDALTAGAGRGNPDWAGRRDPAGRQSSIALLLAEAQVAQAAAKRRRAAPGLSARYRARRSAYAVERTALGLPPAPRGRPRILRAQTTVAGTTVANYGWLVAEWHPTRNGTLRPDQVPAGGGERVWRQCAAGPDHEWQSQVRSRSLRGTGCPFCAHRAIAPSEALSTSHPDIAAQWHSERNGAKTPAQFTYGSHFEAWWQCPKRKSHVWRSRIASRTSMIAGCPHCARAAGKGGVVRQDAVEAAKSA